MSRRRSPEDHLRLCLTGGWFESRNVGDHAILAGITDSIRARCKASVTVFTSGPEKVAEIHGLTAVAPRRNPLALCRALGNSDLLGFTGGTPFYDGLKHMLYFGLLAAAARLRGVPVVIFGISLRTMNNPLCRKLTRFICRSASYLGAREKDTRRKLDELTGQTGRARLLPDPGMQMRPASSAWAAKELKSLGVEGRGPRVAVCLRDLEAPASFRAAHYSQRHSRQDICRLLSAVAELCTSLIKKHRARVIFLPMHTDPPDDDRVPARKCAGLIREPAIRRRVHLVKRQYGPREMKALLGAMDLVIGLRFHSLVLSASMGVPNYALGYAPKNAALMDDFGRRAYAQPIRELDPARLNRQVAAILTSLPEQRWALARRNRDLNRRYATELEKLLGVTRRGG